jgi:glucokinase
MKIAIDIGGTQIRAATFETTIKKRVPITTKEGDTRPAALVLRIAKLVRELLEGEPCAGIGLVVAGPTNGDKGIVYNAPNIQGWETEVPLLDLMQQEFPNVPIAIENDATGAVIGEHK